MMNIRFKAVLPAVCLTAAMLGGYTVKAEDYCETLSYTVSSEGAVITGVKNAPEKLSIPGTIGGRQVVGIRENAFYKCSSLKSVSIPHSVTRIGHHAFYGCDRLEYAEICGDVDKIEEGCFSGCCSLENVDISGNIGGIGKYSFYRCESLESIDLPDTVKEIDKYAFSGCKELKNAKLPMGLVTVGEFAFYDCPGLMSVEIPESTGNIGTCAFGYSGESPASDSEFVVSGSIYSLGRKYADENSFRYLPNGEGDNESEEKTPILPGILAIGAVIGLMIHKMIEKTGELKFRYEYEK